MYEIDQPEPPESFRRAWHEAGMHLQQQATEGIRWLRAELRPPLAEHLAFLLGNQLVFVFVEPEDALFGNKELFLRVSADAKAIPCLMPMAFVGGKFQPKYMGWGLVHALTNEPVNPAVLVSDELIEMSDWELHDMAIQVVRQGLQEEGKEVFSYQPSMEIDPSIWFYDGGDEFWVVVRAARYPATSAEMPANIENISKNCAHKAKGGFFASVGLACKDDPFLPDGEGAIPLYRGHGMFVKYEGLEPVSGGMADVRAELRDTSHID